MNSFFETYAHEYDILTGAKEREIRHQEEVKALIDRFKPRKVLDAGCATGLTSMLFAKNGIATVGLDRSRSMIKIAESKYENQDYPLKFRRGLFERLPKSMNAKFDLVVCLANSISGVGSQLGLKDALHCFRSVIKPNGWLVLQLLNYASWSEKCLTPIKVTMNDGIIYERFAERHRRRFYVYITRLDTNQTPPKLEVFRHDFDNFSVTEVVKEVRAVGFCRVDKYSDLTMQQHYLRNAKDVVLVCKRCESVPRK